MKRHYVVLAALMLLAIVIFACTNSNASKKKEGGILGVADFQSNPSSIKGMVVVTGVVARISKTDKQRFAIIDTEEAKHCKSISCAEFSLPVQFDGPLPKEWDEVNVTGRIVE